MALPPLKQQKRGRLPSFINNSTERFEVIEGVEEPEELDEFLDELNELNFRSKILSDELYRKRKQDQFNQLDQPNQISAFDRVDQPKRIPAFIRPSVDDFSRKKSSTSRPPKKINRLPSFITSIKNKEEMFENGNEKLIEFLDELGYVINTPPNFCAGDHQQTKKILSRIFENESEENDMLEFFKEHGGYCDCEILYNVPDDLKITY